jgi:hypothetical protein
MGPVIHLTVFHIVTTIEKVMEAAAFLAIAIRRMG